MTICVSVCVNMCIHTHTCSIYEYLCTLLYVVYVYMYVCIFNNTCTYHMHTIVAFVVIVIVVVVDDVAFISCCSSCCCCSYAYCPVNTILRDCPHVYIHTHSHSWVLCCMYSRMCGINSQQRSLSWRTRALNCMKIKYEIFSFFCRLFKIISLKILNSWMKIVTSRRDNKSGALSPGWKFNLFLLVLLNLLFIVFVFGMELVDFD